MSGEMNLKDYIKHMKEEEEKAKAWKEEKEAKKRAEKEEREAAAREEREAIAAAKKRAMPKPAEPKPPPAVSSTQTPAQAPLPQGIDPYEDLPGPVLEVIKDSEKVGRFELPEEKETHVVGRKKGEVDILLEHESLSRKHAIFTHQNFQTYLTDLKSNHGTFMNNQRLPPNAPFLVTQGSAIRFGASSRFYIFRQPKMRFHEGLKKQAIQQLERKRKGGAGEVGDEDKRFRYRTTIGGSSGKGGMSDFADS